MLQNYRLAFLGGIQHPALTALWEGSIFYGYPHHSKATA